MPVVGREVMGTGGGGGSGTHKLFTVIVVPGLLAFLVVLVLVILVLVVIVVIVMNTSDGAKFWKMLDNLPTVVFPLPAVLYLKPHTCCEQVLRYSPTVWNPPVPTGRER